MACTDKSRGRISLWICLLMIVSFSNVQSADAANIISQGQVVRLSETILSPGKKFALGFFVPGASTNRYLGIWYNNIPEQTVVWVGNRDQPLSGTSTMLTVSNEGYIVIVDGRVTYRVSENPTSQNASAVLLDSGNLVLRDGNFNTLWQSFDYPSDTLLPGMRIGYNIKTGKSLSLTAWKSAEDPNLGAAELKFNPLRLNEVLLMKGSQVVWSSGVWIGDKFSLIPEMRLNYIFNYTFFSDANETYFTYSLYDSSIISRVQIYVSGQIRQLTWLESAKTWVMFWGQPRDDCEIYAYCGPFSRCISNSVPSCQCLQGFKPSENWKRKDMSGGCERRIPLGCEYNTSGDGDKDGFLKMDNVRTPFIDNMPTTSTAEECKLACLNVCSCTAYAYNSSRMCNLWGEELLNIKQLPKGDPSGQTIYIKVAASELQSSGGNRYLLWIIAIVVSSAVIILASYFFYRWRRRLKESETIEMAQDILLLDVEMSTGTSDKEFSNRDGTGKGKSKDLSLPLFSFVSVSTATDNFSVENKLGEGGFGPVYKGKLRNGQEIAVKRLSRQSGQGLEELKNETMLIAKLQHRNLVRVLGCCIEQGEKILIYEYLPNKSLDSFLFDPTRKGQLNWETRVRIVKGIAQGLLYLHQYSRLRIIHRDLKASNILLDSGMNPKISDFGMARMFGGNELQANTNRIVGTYGYMSPEYAIDGLFSIKSDVFSFGVLLLETLSGKKNTGFYHSDSLHLLAHAWRLWNDDRAQELMDPVLENEASQPALMRYVNVGLLCVQEVADDRPTMSEVVSMITNELVALPSPKEPAFLYAKSAHDSNLPANRPQVCSMNNVTVSILEGR